MNARSKKGVKGGLMIRPRARKLSETIHTQSVGGDKKCEHLKTKSEIWRCPKIGALKTVILTVIQILLLTFPSAAAFPLPHPHAYLQSIVNLSDPPLSSSNSIQYTHHFHHAINPYSLLSLSLICPTIITPPWAIRLLQLHQSKQLYIIFFLYLPL